MKMHFVIALVATCASLGITLAQDSQRANKQEVTKTEAKALVDKGASGLQEIPPIVGEAEQEQAAVEALNKKLQITTTRAKVKKPSPSAGTPVESGKPKVHEAKEQPSHPKR